MKTTIINTIILIFLFSCNSNNVTRENDLKDLGLNGSVKSIVEIEYNVEEKFGEIQLKNQNWKKELYFNEKGYINKSKSSFSDGSGSVILYKYDQGNLIEVGGYNLDGNLRWKDISKYDKNHNKIEIIEFNAEGDLSGKIKFKYNENGVKLEAKNYDSEGQLTSSIKFDDFGNEIEYSKFDNNILYYKDTRKFDKQNNEVEKEILNKYTEMFYDINGNNVINVMGWHYINENGVDLEEERNIRGGLINSNQLRRDLAIINYKYRYDANDNKTEESVFINNNPKFAAKKTWEYNEDGNVIEEIYYDSTGESYTTSTIEYENNLKIKEYRYDSDGKKSLQFTWKYDERGNLLQEINQINNQIFEHGWVYDKNNNVIEEYIRGDYGGWKKVVKYDSFNNWIEETNFNIKNIPTSQKQRIIEYY